MLDMTFHENALPWRKMLESVGGMLAFGAVFFCEGAVQLSDLVREVDVILGTFPIKVAKELQEGRVPFVTNGSLAVFFFPARVHVRHSQTKRGIQPQAFGILATDHSPGKYSFRVVEIFF